MTFERITVHPGQMGGAPCIRGLRIPVATVVAMGAPAVFSQDALSGGIRRGGGRHQRR
ncbi:MAG TPA: DUF433 domain-containing protein [Micromonosporaceae bacterium]|nr:DUF433 domain-containing protein [Micromonosporaceae bacterium]